MSEANNNVTSFSSESNLNSNQNHDLHSRDSETVALESQNTSHTEQKMNWQKVAHKLREYNRKLLKQVFRLEQELAEVNNQFKKHTEESQNSDLIVAQQESEIQEYQQQLASLNENLATFQQELSQKETKINELSQQYKLSQQQAALLERDCTLLQESYSQKSYELIAKEKEAQDLQTKFNQQQRYALQYKAELKRHQEKPTIPFKEPAVNTRQNNSQRRSIQPWSTSNTSEPKIALPKTKAYSGTPSQPTSKSNKSKFLETVNTAIAHGETRFTREPHPSSARLAVKTAAEIATWSTSQVQEKQVKTNNQNKSKSKSSVVGKPKSLAAVDLPTFPRPM